MRRLIAITLLLFVGLPLLSPLFAASATNNTLLPACCRRNGTHHCAMLMQHGLDNDDGKAHLDAEHSQCPFYPASISYSSAHFDPPLFEEAAEVSLPVGLAEIVAQTEARYRISFDRARQKRGPPGTLSSLL